MLLVSGCAAGGQLSKANCTDAVRLTDEQINSLSEKQVNDILYNNERLAKRGCATPNR